MGNVPVSMAGRKAAMAACTAACVGDTTLPAALTMRATVMLASFALNDVMYVNELFCVCVRSKPA